jgi:hypothetical protein
VTRRRSREARRSAFMLIGGALLSIVILGRLVPRQRPFHQHSSLASANAELNELHQQDAALAQERKDLSDSSEIARIAREQYQLVDPGQQAYEVLPPTGDSKASTPYAGDPALNAPVAPSSASVLPPGSAIGTTQSSFGEELRCRPRRLEPSDRGTCTRVLRPHAGHARILALNTDEPTLAGVAPLTGRPRSGDRAPGPGSANGNFVVAVRRRDGRPAGDRQRPAPARRAAHAHPLLAGRPRDLCPCGPAGVTGRRPQGRERGRESTHCKRHTPATPRSVTR